MTNLQPIKPMIEVASKQPTSTDVTIYNSSHWGKIIVSDRDRIRFLHNQSTADFERLKSGEGCDTVFVTSTARTIDLVTGLVLADEVLLLVSPTRREYLFNWLDRYIFFADQVQLVDATDRLASFTLMGAASDQILSELGCTNFTNLEYNCHQLSTLAGVEVRLVGGTELGLPGYRLICDQISADVLYQKLTDLGAISIDDRAWECLRIKQGRPKPDAELTEEYNPLEVGLWQTISFTKGCYIGQETIARLNTYQGIKQHLWGLKLTAPVDIGTSVTIDDQKVGILTSCGEIDGQIVGLSYIRAKAGGVGLKVLLGEVVGEVVDIPFVTHEYPVNK